MADHADHVPSTYKLGTGLTVRWEHPILSFKGHSLCDCDGFLTQRSHVEGQLSCALHFDHSIVKYTQPHHVFEALDKGFSIELWIPFSAGNTVVIEDPDQTNRMVNGVLSAACEGVWATQVAWLLLEFAAKISLLSWSKRRPPDGVRRRRGSHSLGHWFTSFDAALKVCRFTVCLARNVNIRSWH